MAKQNSSQFPGVAACNCGGPAPWLDNCQGDGFLQRFDRRLGCMPEPHMISSGEPAWQAHEGHGDTIGECPDNPEIVSDDDDTEEAA